MQLGLLVRRDLGLRPEPGQQAHRLRGQTGGERGQGVQADRLEARLAACRAVAVRRLLVVLQTPRDVATQRGQLREALDGAEPLHRRARVHEDPLGPVQHRLGAGELPEGPLDVGQPHEGPRLPHRVAGAADLREGTVQDGRRVVVPAEDDQGRRVTHRDLRRQLARRARGRLLELDEAGPPSPEEDQGGAVGRPHVAEPVRGAARAGGTERRPQVVQGRVGPAEVAQDDAEALVGEGARLGPRIRRQHALGGPPGLVRVLDCEGQQLLHRAPTSPPGSALLYGGFRAGLR